MEDPMLTGQESEIWDEIVWWGSKRGRWVTWESQKYLTILFLFFIIKLGTLNQGTPMLASPFPHFPYKYCLFLKKKNHVEISVRLDAKFLWGKNREKVREKKKKGKNQEKNLDKKKSLSFSLGNHTPKAPSFLHCYNLLWVRIWGWGLVH